MGDEYSLLNNAEMISMYKTYGGNIEQHFDTYMKAHQEYVKHKEHVELLKKNYEREKVAIEAKLNSTTQLKNTLFRNTKIENKISTADTTADTKLQYFDDQVRLNEEKRDRDIQAVKEKYEARMTAEINAIEARADKYHNYIITQRKQLEVKKQLIIRDLSANIIEPKIGDVFDEDAFPKLSKLKYDIQLEENKLPELKTEEDRWCKYQQFCSQRNLYIARENMKREEAQAKREEERIREEAIRQRQIEREAQAKIDEARWKRQSEERMAKEKAEEDKKNWKDNVYKQLTDDYKRYYAKMDYELREKVHKLSKDKVIDYIDNIKTQLDALIKMDTLSNEEEERVKHMKDELWDMYDALPFKHRIIVATQKKLKQIVLIKEFHAQLPKPETEDD